MAETLKKYRCAIYTRKSHEEGLEQSFNSLDAQREAGVAYIASQKHEGWSVISTHYDDGGYSGGSMVRPALSRLLDDVRAGKIDVIVVYKVDRLSRSINDFASMMTLFDAENVSFVSVTQQFNTTTSMGRLTLNMLLSFAQFEREVTGERIRDKFAASKQKGMWMGGSPPLGYDVKDRQLIINKKEAPIIKLIFESYGHHSSLIKLSQDLNEQGYTTKAWVSQTNIAHEGKPITPKYIHRILTNPIYNGKICHKDKVYAGQHQAIIDDELWANTQSLINKKNKQPHQLHHPFLLKGKIKTSEGVTMSPSTSQRSHKRMNGKKKTVRYYISQKAISQGYKNCPIKLLNADQFEDIIQAQILDYVSTHFPDHLVYYQSLPTLYQQQNWLRESINQIEVSPEKIIISLNKPFLTNIKPPLKQKTQSLQIYKAIYTPKVFEQDSTIELHLAIQIKKNDGKRLVLSNDGKDLILPAQPTPNASIRQAIGRAFYWKEQLSQPNMKVNRFAKEINIKQSYVRHILKLINLAPDIIHQALAGTLPTYITLNALIKAAQTLDWKKQRTLLGL